MTIRYFDTSSLIKSSNLKSLKSDIEIDSFLLKS